MRKLKISEGVYAAGLAVYLEGQEALVFGDMHIGYEEALNKQGLMLPRQHYSKVIEWLEPVLKMTKPKIIVINGDLKHEFGTISDQEWRDTLDFLDRLSSNAKVILVKGNHDTILGPIAKKREIEVVDHVLLGDVYICHGHKLPADDVRKAKTVIISHEHPSIGLRRGPRVERFKCFLVGKWKRKGLVVLPSSNPLIEGSDIGSEQTISPLMEKGCSSFRVWAYDDVENTVLDFGIVKDLPD